MYEEPGCTDPAASNYDANATEENGSCIYPTTGCMDQTACNFNFMATEDDGSCEFTSCSGCLSPSACNYDADATLDDGSCEFPDANGDCPGDIVGGCIYEHASNYNANATTDDGSCMFDGCENDSFSNYNPYANNDGGCTNAPMNADFNGDGVVQIEDLLEFLISYGQTGPDWTMGWVADACGVVPVPADELVDMTAPGCTYENAVNYDASATVDAGNCAFTGCTDAAAMNFNSLANIDDSSCTYSVCPDFNGDGAVQAEDLLDFLIVWGTIYD